MRRLPSPHAVPPLRDPLPDLVEFLRLAFDGPGQPMFGLERWFDRMETAR